LIVSTINASAFNTVENSLTTTTNSIIYVPDDYRTIQAAVDAAVDGNTIVVKEGIYAENIVINKKLSVLAYDQYTAVITGDLSNGLDNQFNPLVEIEANGVYLWGFKIEIYTGPISYLKGIYIKNSEDITIVQNILTNGNENKNGLGIDVEYSKNIEIIDNDITNCNICGIRIKSSNYNIIRDNAIVDCEEYGGIWISDGNNNIIYNNEIFSNDAWGIRLDNTHYNNIDDNRIEFNSVHLSESNYNTVTNNKLMDAGIYLYRSNYNTVTNNKLRLGGSIGETECEGNDISGNDDISISKPLSRIVSSPFVEKVLSNLKIQSLFSIFKQFVNK
jgi:parallel beta-helix repeat protein